MKLHVLRASHNCRRVLATAAQLGLDITIIEPEMSALKTAAFLALNPNGKVPTLEADGFSLWESNAIMQYFGTIADTDALYPSDAEGRAAVHQWQFWEANHLSSGTGPIVFERLFKPMFMKMEPDEAVVAEGIAAFHRFAPVLNGHLEGRAYICGDALTIADFSVAANFSYAAPAQIPVGDYPHIVAWLARLDAIPAWSESAPKF